MSDRICPICGEMAEDMRHVGVECFYDVKEYVPSAEERMIFKEVDENGSYWGRTRRYPAGTKDSFSSRPEIRNGETINICTTTQVPIEKIRLIESSNYSKECCKSCRHDFLCMFKMWSEGRLVKIEDAARSAIARAEGKGQ